MNTLNENNIALQQQIKADLWKRFGSLECPAEWDGINYGGGKMSQRWWEYFKAIEFLDLAPESVILDIGGGSRKTGAGFFAQLIQPYVKKIIVADPCVSPDIPDEDNLVFIREYLGPIELKNILESNINITHIVSISVLEHIEDDLRRDLMKVINRYFTGSSIVSTFEFHSKKCFFDYQLTTRTLSDTFSGLANFYPSRIESAPMWCTNAFDEKSDAPRWYPMAVRFDAML